MASIFSINGNFNVEYSISTGEPREVEIDGVCIYRTEAEAARTRPPNNVAVEVPDWKKRFADKYVALGLHLPSSDGLYRAPTFWLADNNLIEAPSNEQA